MAHLSSSRPDGSLTSNGTLSPNGMQSISQTTLQKESEPLVDPSFLPSSNDPDGFQLVIATDEEIERQQRSNAISWKGSLNLEQYLRREALLADQDLTRNGGMTTWVLTHPKLPTRGNERIILCGVESFTKRALVKNPDSQIVEDVICQGVASVFCPPEFRKRGYAGVMMALLAKELKSHKVQGDERRVAFSVLFSDIGKEFYDKHGWEPFESTHISLPAAPPSQGVKLPLTRPVESQDLPTLCKADEVMLRKWFGEQGPNDKAVVAILPDLPSVMWLHAREDYVCNELMGRYPGVKGAQVSLGEGKNAWCYWTRMYYNEDTKSVAGNTFYILRLVVDESINDTEEGEMAVAALLQAAQREARQWNMENVTIWNPSDQTLRSAARALGVKLEDVELVHRADESIASLLWYGSGTNHSKKSRDMVDWVANEKFAWC